MEPSSNSSRDLSYFFPVLALALVDTTSNLRSSHHILPPPWLVTNNSGSIKVTVYIYLISQPTYDQQHNFVSISGYWKKQSLHSVMEVHLVQAHFTDPSIKPAFVFTHFRGEFIWS